MIRVSAVACAILFWTAVSSVSAAIPEPVRLWPKDAPGASGTAEHDTPTVRPYLPVAEQRTGAAIIVCPGGGYGVLASDHEGHQVASWLSSRGVTAFVLRYRHAPHYRHPVPLNDAQRAIRFVRANSKRFGVDPDRLGIMGFSAGGHLAATAATHFDRGRDGDDPIDKYSCRPDFAVLCYPVISMTASFTHHGSVRNLLGSDPDPALTKSLSNETQVTGETPPTFLFHTAEDKAVPVENSLAFFGALMKHGVKAEIHVYQHGPHGVGLATGHPVTTTWKERLLDWMKSNGILVKGQRAAVSGAIKWKGKPLRWGMITLKPSSKQAPIVATLVSRGRFSFTAASGPQRGPHTVVVHSLGDVRPEPTIDHATCLTPRDPALTVVILDGTNTFEFELD